MSFVVRDRSAGPWGEYGACSERPDWRSTGGISFVFVRIPYHGLQVYEASLRRVCIFVGGKAVGGLSRVSWI